MITSIEIIQALYGTWRIISWDQKSSEFFDASIRAFWLSFFPAILIGPFQILYASGVYFNLANPPASLFFTTISLLEYVILWVTYPLLVFYIVKLIKRADNFELYIIMYNWFQLAASLLIMPLQIASAFKLIHSNTYLIAYTIILVLYLVYTPFIARISLKINTSQSYAVIGADIFLTLIIGKIIFLILLV